jgi:hypothetical protein
VCVLLIVVCPFVLFLLASIVLSVLQYTESDYPLGIFKQDWMENIKVKISSLFQLNLSGKPLIRISSTLYRMLSAQ